MNLKPGQAHEALVTIYVYAHDMYSQSREFFSLHIIIYNRMRQTKERPL